MSDKYIEGGAMGYSNAELKTLHEVAENERARQSEEIKKEQDRIIAETVKAKQEHEENTQFLTSFIEKIRLVHDHGHGSYIALPDGGNLKILKGPESVTIAVVPDSTSAIYTPDNRFGDEVEFLICFIRMPNGKEDLYIWDKSSLNNSNQNRDRSTYSYANLHFSDLESADSVSSVADLKVQQLKSLLPFDLNDLDQSLAAQS